MAEYRIYLLDEDGRIISAYSKICHGDDEARAAARKGLGIGGQAEVWQGIRCLGRVNGMPPGHAPDPAGAIALR